jgi:hypothetical protein
MAWEEEALRHPCSRRFRRFHHFRQIHRFRLNRHCHYRFRRRFRHSRFPGRFRYRRPNRRCHPCSRRRPHCLRQSRQTNHPSLYSSQRQSCDQSNR